MSTWDKQIGGTHYKQFAIQPAEYIHKNKLGYMVGNVIKYVSRWEIKHNLDDLRKAAHYIELLMSMELTPQPEVDKRIQDVLKTFNEADLPEYPETSDGLLMTDDGEPFTPTHSRMYDF